MDEIGFKLSSKNPILITHGMSKILQTAKNTKDPQQKQAHKEVIDSLFSRCTSEFAAVSSVACESIVSLVEIGVLERNQTISKLVPLLNEAHNCSGIISAVAHLLKVDIKASNSKEPYTCQYSINTPQHPLITVLVYKGDAWRSVLRQMELMLHEQDSVNYIELLRPVFMYILCNPDLPLSESCRHQTWALLVNTNGAVELQLEVLQWLRVNDTNSCIHKNDLLLQLTKAAIAKEDRKLCTALAPLVMALTLDLLEYNLEPASNLDTIENLLHLIDQSVVDIIVALLCETILITPSLYLHNILKIGKSIIDICGCNKVVAYSLVSSILPWMAYSNPLSSNALDIGRELIDATISLGVKFVDKLHDTNDFFDILYNSNENLQLYTYLCRHIVTQSNENLIILLGRLSEASLDSLYKYKLILGGVFLHTSNLTITQNALKLFKKIIKYRQTFAGHVLALILYKLANAHDVEETKELFFALPELATSKENVPIIVQTLQTMLEADEPLKYLAINLYLKTWMIEPRCHRHLFTALINMNKNDNTIKGNSTCAKALKFICENKPEHGAELVPLLSQTLNRCTDTAGSAASALALEGISALCLSGIADVCSTWKVLAPKMNQEQRIIVIKSLCRFFADIPANASHLEDEFEILVDEVLTKLWEYACFETTRNMEVVGAAFKALSAFKLNKMKLSVFPEQFRGDDLSNDACVEKKLPDVPIYIPGKCLVTMLETIHEPSRTFAGDLLIKFISDELYTFRSGIYMWPMGEPINFKYLSERSPIRYVGEYIRRYSSNSPPEKQKVLLECLRIFAHKYLKPLPPVKWNLLTSAITMNDQAWSYGISLACHQAAMNPSVKAISPSAKEFISKHIVEMTEQCNSLTTVDEFKKCWHLCIHLEDLCRGVMANVLGPFLEATMNYIIDKAIVDKDNTAAMFDELMEYYSKSLVDDLVHHDTKSVLTNILEKLSEKIDVNSKLFPSLVNAMVRIPVEHIERITLPSVWNEVSVERLQKSIVIRAGLVLKRDNEIPLSWMNEIIRASASIPDVHMCLLENLKRIQSQLRNEKSNATWTWELMCQIKAAIIDSTEKCYIDRAVFLCDILLVTVIIFAYSDFLISDDELIIISSHVRAQLFPHAIHQLTLMPQWKEMTHQIMEWLHSMRSSSLPAEYNIVFHNALVSLKRERYLNNSWMKYLSIKGLNFQ